MSKKMDIINDAYSQLRISGLTVQPTPEILEAALTRYENMMAELDSRSICLGYNFENIPDANSNTDVLHAFNHMMATNLAVRLVPDFNKVVPPTLQAQANQSMSNASSFSARNNINQVPYPNRQPIGSANTLRYNWGRRYYREEKPIKTDCDNNKMFIGDVDNFYEDFHTYLSGDTILSYEIEGTNGITVTNDSIDGERIKYTVTAVSSSESNFQRVRIIMTTNTSRVETRIINFNVRASDKVF